MHKIPTQMVNGWELLYLLYKLMFLSWSFFGQNLTGLVHFSRSHVREKFFKKHVELLKSLPVRGVSERKGFCISEWVMRSKRKLLCFFIFPCGTRVVYFHRIDMVEISSLHWWTWAIGVVNHTSFIVFALVLLDYVSFCLCTSPHHKTNWLFGTCGFFPWIINLPNVKNPIFWHFNRLI